MSATIAVPRAVLYDWDNTLVDNWGTILAALNHALVLFGHEPWTVAESRVRIKQSLRDSFPRIFGDRWTDARDAFYRHFEDHHLEHLTPLPGAEELLAALHDKGVYQAVVSNKNGRYLRAEAAALGWTRYFGRLVGAQDAAFDKPHGAPVLKALEPAGILAGPDVWFVGDADIDMECAHGAGLLPVLVGEADGEGFLTFPPSHRFDTCASLRALVCGEGDTISVSAIAEAVQRSPRSDGTGGGS